MMHFLFQNMLQIIQQSPSGLPPNLTRNYTYQLLKALFACHSRNIIHQDVKPENMLVTSDNVLKLCDFGYAVRSVNSNGTSSNLESSVYTEFIATRWYRSPEVLLGARCGKDADMWSAGCIVGEMADGRPLFPGQSELDQLFVIQTVLGPLSTRQRNMFYTSPRYTQLRLPTVAKASKGLDKRYRHKMCAKLLDCMKGLLAIDACNRLDVNQALRHKVFIPEVAMDASNANHRSNHHTPTVTSSSPALHSHRSSDDQGSPYLDSGGEGSPTQHYGSGAGKANRHSIAVHMNEVANKRAPTSNMENRKDYGSLRKPMRDPSQKVLKRTTSNKDTLFGAYRDAHQSKVTCDTQPNSSPNDNQNQQPKYSYMPLKSNSSNSSGSNKQANNQSSSFIQDAINSFWTDGPNSILAPPSNLQHLNAATPGLSQSQGQTNKQQPLNNLDIRQKADPKIDSYQFSQTGVVRPAKFSPGGGDTLPFADDLEASMLSIEAAVDTTLEKIARNNNIYNGHRFATDESFKSSRDTESQAKDSTLRASQFENPSDDIYSRSVPPAIAADDFCEDFEDEMDAEFSEEPITKEMKPVSPYHSRVDRLKVGSQFDRRPHSSGDNKPMLCDAELSDETGSSGPSVGDVANITSGASHDKTFSENERPESETKLVAPIAPLVDESFDLEYQCDQILESNITRSGTWCDEDRSREPANQPVQKNSNRLIPGAVHMETLPIPKQRDAQPTRERNRASSENRGNRVRQMVETSVDSGHSSNYVRLEANIDHPGLFAKLAGGQLPQGEKVGNESPRSKSSSKKSSQELSPLPPSKFKTPPMSPNADHTETVHDHHHHHTSSADSSKLIDDDDKYFDCPLSQVDSDTLSIRDPGMPISFSDNFDPQSHRDIGSQQALQNEETSQSLELDAISDSFDSSEALLSKGKLHSLLDKTADAPFTSVSTDKLEIVMDDSKLNSAILSADSTKFESNTECGINSCKTLKGAAPIATTHVFHCGDDSRIESSEPEFSDQCTHNSIDATTVTPAEFVPNSENLNMETEISPGDNGAALKSSEVSRLRQLRQTMSRSLYNEATESHVQLDSGPSYLPLSSSTEHGHHLGGEGEQESVVPYPPLRSPILTTNYSIQAPDKENNRLATQSKRPRSAVTQATRSFRPAALPAGSGDWGNKTTSPVSTSSSNGHDRRYHPRSPPPSAPPLAKSEIFDDDTPWLASGDSYDRDITIGRRPRCSTTSSGSNHHQHQSNNSPMDIRTKRAPPNQLPSPLLRTSPSSHCDLSSGGSTGSSSAGHHFSAATTPASPTGYSPRGGAGTRDTATLERGQMSASHSPLDMIRGALIPRSNHSNNGTHHQQPGRKGRSSSTLRRSCSYESISTEHNSSTSKQPSQKKTSIGLQLLRQIGLKRIRKFGSTAATNTAGNTPTSSGTRCPNGSGGCNDNVCGSCLPTASSPSGGNGGGVNLCCPPSSACSTQFKYR
ncbi:uncharacterized protein LOC142341419 isoform X2 [Convolutriloba macropyga]|uniref:uncharacterized protein LOC142341419 isoform X2 n=1 Tax=Convolutriloba macropyga TaxID=536237 RepID=UPI003F523402